MSYAALLLLFNLVTELGHKVMPGFNGGQEVYSFCWWQCVQLKKQGSDSGCKVEEEWILAGSGPWFCRPHSFIHSLPYPFLLILPPFILNSVTHPLFLFTNSFRNKLHSLSDISMGQMPYQIEKIYRCKKPFLSSKSLYTLRERMACKLTTEVHDHKHYHPHQILWGTKEGGVCHAWVSLSTKSQSLLLLGSELSPWEQEYEGVWVPGRELPLILPGQAALFPAKPS